MIQLRKKLLTHSLPTNGCLCCVSKGVDPYIGQGDMSPNIYEETSMVMSPQYFARFILSSNSNNCCFVCCILMQILCVVSQKASASGGLCSPDPQSSFMSPNTPVRSMPLCVRFSFLSISQLEMRVSEMTYLSVKWEVKF